MIDFNILWQPIVLVNDPPELPPHRIAAGQLQIQPPNGQDLASWWTDRLRRGEGDQVQGQLEFRLSPYLAAMQRVTQWHLPLHPAVLPATRDWWPFWVEAGHAPHLVYELPVDESIDDWVWAEIELVRRTMHQGAWPLVAGTHVGRRGLLTPGLADRLNGGRFAVLLLDPAVSAGLTNVALADPAIDQRRDALSAFLQALRPDLPVVATGVSTVSQWQGLAACGLVYGQGPLWMPPTSLADTFDRTAPAFDPDWFPEKAYPQPEDIITPYGLVF